MENSNQPQQTNHEEIGRLAYQIWEQRGRPNGCDMEFWLEAERQILSSNKPSQKQPTGSARTTDAVAVQAQPSRTAAHPALPLPPRTSKEAARTEGKVKQTTPRAAMPSVPQTKPTPRAAARP